MLIYATEYMLKWLIPSSLSILLPVSFNCTAVFGSQTVYPVLFCSQFLLLCLVEGPAL